MDDHSHKKSLVNDGSHSYKSSVVSALTGTLRVGIAASTELSSVDASLFRSRVSREFAGDDHIAPMDQVLLEWRDIKFFVPAKKAMLHSEQGVTSSSTELLIEEDEQLKVNEDTGIPEPTIVSRGGKAYKQVLQGNSGYVRPKEMVAIMGPSGSGKTSLLNVLSQRTSLSGGSYVDGEVCVNGRALQAGDFGKIGAFVQQDDVLVQTFTPKELLTFAARIRTNLTAEFIALRVNKIIKRLGLENCEDTVVGGFLRKGISGGERKRTSIGYELITEPSLLMLDEPTSGLDSHTSEKIVRLMRAEANRGGTLIATIHQPSGTIFQLFDRVILLSDGYLIYNGPPETASLYFQ